MENRDCSIEELKSFFKIEDEKINEFLIHKIDEGLESRLNNFPTHKNALIEAYIKGKEDFLSELKKQHEELLNKLKADVTIPDSVGNKSDIDIALKLFSEQCDQNHQVEAMIRSFNRVYEEILKKDSWYETSHYRGVVYLYSEIYFDIKSCWGNCGRRGQQSADLDIFALAKELLRHSFFYNQPVIPSTIILIRQAIETKILQTFGIQKFLKNDGSEAIVGINKLLTFCKEKSDINLLEFPVDIELIIKINKWCNFYVHTGNFSIPTWKVEWLPHILQPLFSGGQDQYCMALERSIVADESYFNTDLFPDLEGYLSSGNRPITVAKTDHKFLLKTLQIA
jgi:hypothetical protein